MYARDIRKQFTIRKRRGEVRQITVLTDQAAEMHRFYIRALEPLLDEAPHPECSHCRRGCNTVTNALPHLGWHWTLQLDIANCFDSIPANWWLLPALHALKVKIVRCPSVIAGIKQHYLFSVVADRLSREGKIVQGPPSSPLLCNLFLAYVLDPVVMDAPTSMPYVYTRYLDDLTISSDSRSTLENLHNVIRQRLESLFMQLAERKTLLVDRLARAVHIAGISIKPGAVELTVPRYMRRKLRAAERAARTHRHVDARHRAAGLSAYCRLRPPRMTVEMLRAVEILENTNHG